MDDIIIAVLAILFGLSALFFGIVSSRQKKSQKEFNMLNSAISQVYPFIAIINVSDDTCSLISGADWLSYDVPERMSYSEFIANADSSIVDEDYLDEFKRLFNRMSLLYSYDSENIRIKYRYLRLFSSGERHWVESMVVFFTESESTDDIRAIYLSRIVDLEKRQEDEISKAREDAELADRSKMNFLNRLGKDVRSPLSIILGVTRLAKSNLGDIEKTSVSLDRIEDSSKRLMTIIDDILDVARINNKNEKIVRELVDTKAAMDKLDYAINDYAKTAGVAVFADRKILYNYVYADEVHINRVLLSVVNCELDYSPTGSTIETFLTETPLREDGWLRAEFVMRAKDVFFSPEQIDNLYSILEDNDNSLKTGTSIGMSIAKSLVELMGGSIKVESSKEEGLVVSVTLDLEYATDEAIKGIKNDKDSVSLKGRRVLVVEDNELNREIACEILESEGIITECAENGLDALDVLKKNGPGAFDIILMDIEMPKLNGYDTSKTIRSLDDIWYLRVPIIAMTANVNQEDVDEAYASGMDDHIGKPIDVDELFRKIKAHI